jgi:hypothetical protein
VTKAYATVAYVATGIDSDVHGIHLDQEGRFGGFFKDGNELCGSIKVEKFLTV